MNIDAGAAHNAAGDAYLELLVHRGSHAYKACTDWIEALIAQQQAMMISCARDKLPDAQIRLRQLIALHTSLQAPDGAGTGHVFD